MKKPLPPKHWPVLLALVLSFLAVAGSAIAADRAEGTISNESLYYAVERQFPATRWEARASAAYDFSNPYLHVMGGQGTMFWTASRYVAFGVELGAYTSALRGSASQIEQEMKRHGYRLRTEAPDYGAVAIMRVTPLSGLVNFFSSSVLQAELGLLLRTGATRYVALGWGPTFGTGLEVNLRAPSGWGMVAALVFDWDRTSDNTWQTRAGVRLGPTYRF